MLLTISLHMRVRCRSRADNWWKGSRHECGQTLACMGKGIIDPNPSHLMTPAVFLTWSLNPGLT